MLARAAANSPFAIGSALDAGTDGVLVPMIETAEQAAAAVSAARFHRVAIGPAVECGHCRWALAPAYLEKADAIGRTLNENIRFKLQSGL